MQLHCISGLSLAVIILAVSSCVEYSDAEQLSDRIVPIGKLIANLNRSVNHFDNSPGIVLLLKDNRLPDGVMFATSNNYRSSKPVRVQVWRPTNTPSTYKLVWERRFEPTRGAPGDLQHTYFYSKNETLCYHFRHDDRVGVYFEEVPVAIPCVFNQNTKAVHARPSNSSVPFQLEEKVSFDNLNLPYECSVEAYVDTVDNLYLNDSRDWVPCPDSAIPVDQPSRGATGYTGPRGPAGATGITGPKGDRGPMGPPGVPGTLSNDSSKWSDYHSPSAGPNTLSIIELVWLCLLTIAVIVIMLVIVYLHVIRRRQNNDEVVDDEAGPSNHRVFSTKRSRTSSARDDVLHWSDLKEETESTYSVHTMKDTTPLRSTGPFVYDNDSQRLDGQAPAGDAATLDVSSTELNY